MRPLPVRLLVVERHPVLRVGIRETFRGSEEVVVVGEAGAARDAIRLARTERPEVAVVGTELTDGSGIELIRHLRTFTPPIRSIAMVALPDEQVFFHAVVAGALGCVTDDLEATELRGAVHTIVGGGSLVHADDIDELRQRMRRQRRDEGLPGALTGQERRILGMVIEGDTNGEIADRLSLAEKTVRNYMTNILVKTGARNRTELTAHAVRWAMRHHADQPPVRRDGVRGPVDPAAAGGTR